MKISLSEILHIENPKDYKVHLASRNSDGNPLDIFVRSPNEAWKEWNESRRKQNDFNRKYIFTLIDYYHERNVWLFGGIYEVVKRLPLPSTVQWYKGYEVTRIGQYESLIGRLKVHWKRESRGSRARLMEHYFDDFTVSEILRDRYQGEVFPGFEDINHDFSILKNISGTSKSNWASALGNVKGVYLITDKSNGKKYVGSACGEGGIWSRWCDYLNSGHGGNKELAALIDKEGKDHALKNFRFVLLEYRPMDTDDEVISKRETYWKKALLSKESGYNKN